MSIQTLPHLLACSHEKYHLDDICSRGSIPAKVGFWVILRIFSYVPTPTKLTNTISKTQLSGSKKEVFSPKIPQKCPSFCFWRFLAVFSGFKPAEWALHHFFVSLLLQLGEKKSPQEFGKENLTLSLTKLASIGYFSAFFAFISRYVMPIRCLYHFHSLQIQIHFHCQFHFHSRRHSCFQLPPLFQHSYPLLYYLLQY